MQGQSPGCRLLDLSSAWRERWAACSTPLPRNSFLPRAAAATRTHTPVRGGASAGAPIIGWGGWRSARVARPSLTLGSPGPLTPVLSRGPAELEGSTLDSCPRQSGSCTGAPARLLAEVGGEPLCARISERVLVMRACRAGLQRAVAKEVCL